MQKYNTTLNKIQLPEYGRNIENLVKYCKSIPDRNQRTRYAYGIINFMARVTHIDNPTDSQTETFWDHLAQLSNFELDIDYPYEIIKKESLSEKPEPLGYSDKRIKARQYGLIVERMIQEALGFEDADKRINLLERCANHMKLQFHLANKEADEDNDKIMHDLREYVGTKYYDDCDRIKLYSLKELNNNQQYDPSSIVVSPKKKKKKKKKK